jgi:hypothetical protein
MFKSLVDRLGTKIWFRQLKLLTPCLEIATRLHDRLPSGRELGGEVVSTNM